MSEKLKTFITRFLLAFVLVSIGFALGKHVAGRKTRQTSTLTQQPAARHQIVVYYFHATIRCVSCNKIEKMAHDFLTRTYPEDLETQKILWLVRNFEEEKELAKKFDILSSCIVVARLVDGKVVEFQRLDQVWELMDKPQAFDDCLRKAIERYRRQGGQIQ